VGVGVTMTLPMDLRIASERARFGFVFARRGIVPEAASSWFLPRVVGISRAMEWVATGRIFPAAEALEGGLVSRVVPHEELLPTARALAGEIAAHTSGVSVSLARQMLWKMLGANHPMDAHELDSRLLRQMGRSPDAYEGVQSFLEKRPPRFAMSPRGSFPSPIPGGPSAASIPELRPRFSTRSQRNAGNDQRAAEKLQRPRLSPSSSQPSSAAKTGTASSATLVKVARNWPSAQTTPSAPPKCEMSAAAAKAAQLCTGKP